MGEIAASTFLDEYKLLEVKLWKDGDVSLDNTDQTIVLSPSEARQLLAWLQEHVGEEGEK